MRMLQLAQSSDGCCLPAVGNRVDEIRWANRHYEQRQRPAAEGLPEVMRAEFG